MKTLVNIILFIGVGTAAIGQMENVPEWQKYFNISRSDDAYSVVQSADSTLGVAGSIDIGQTPEPIYNIVVIKLKPNGDTLWTKSINNENRDGKAYSIVANWDGGYTVTGYRDTIYEPEGYIGYTQFYAARLDGNGTVVWQKRYPASDNTDGVARSISHTADGGYIIAGDLAGGDSTDVGYHGGDDIKIVKIDSLGNKQWEKYYGGSSAEIAYSIIQTTDGGYAVAGFTESNDGDVTGLHNESDYWVLKLNSTGAIEWAKCYGGAFDDKAYSIIQTSDGGYAVAGSSESEDSDVSGNHTNTMGFTTQDFWVIKLNTSGDLEWGNNFGGSDDESAHSIYQTGDGNYVIAGNTSSSDGDVVSGNVPNIGAYEPWLIKIDNLGALVSQSAIDDNEYTDLYTSSMTPTFDGGYVFTGDVQKDSIVPGIYYHYENDIWIAKVILGTTGINEITSQTNISLYPNPATTQLFVSSKSEPIQDISLFSITGKEVLNKAILPEFENSSSVQIDVSSLPAGVYLLKAKTAKGVLTRKWVKE